MLYEKTATTIAEQIALLKERGLEITDDRRAEKYLITVGYYRLTGYMYHFQLDDGRHKFKKGTTFEDIIDTYNFDKKLRYLIAAYLERIEVATRALLTNNYSLAYGLFWYTDRKHFNKPEEIDQDLLDKLKKGNKPIPRRYIDSHNYINNCVKENFDKATELFITKFKEKYSDPLPPSNMALEILSMGKLARLYEALKSCKEKTGIASAFGIPEIILISWLTYLTNIRNICAHHARLWNRGTSADRFIIPAKKSIKFAGELLPSFNSSLYGTISVMIRLLNAINPENSMIKKFSELLKEYPKINISYMGFPADWEKNPAWKMNSSDNH
ncbi:Abortive infection bacteriophage resistance protein [Pedobacter westerhofensis]|uniref:Abortive infection bacteriophage resistance protein n=1 Tax=Pedobacter westerhofensis TaxID=425512 RepID=A0A521FQ15_9SPHI|nr:Abi family protein [Pedobacter westerhofensis]SMO98305.1 Abortive infection bacteriophage resistance protein [Pedobacter westerhofensis]